MHESQLEHHPISPLRRLGGDTLARIGEQVRHAWLIHLFVSVCSGKAPAFRPHSSLMMCGGV